MRNQWIAAVVALSALVGGPLAAEEKKARTEELPPALLALGVEESRILTATEADDVRGEAITLASAIAITDPFSGVTQTVFAIGFATPGVNVFAFGNLVGDPVTFNVINGPNGGLSVSIR